MMSITELSVLLQTKMGIFMFLDILPLMQELIVFSSIKIFKKYKIIQCEFDEFERFYYDLAASCFLQTIIFLKAQQAMQVIFCGYIFLIALRHLSRSFSDSCGCLNVPPRSMVVTILKPE